ncbi:MAG TPA: GTPase, partial [Gemmataceae bacterium]|nr:GTPase [Gemmataceae bacterium]
MLDNLKRLFSKEARAAGLKTRLERLRSEVPVPVFWLIGKTQTGKTSIIKYLTGAEDAEIGQGFKPCTRFSRQYQFPTADAPLLTFLDTRGMDEPGYDPQEDLEKFAGMA